MPAKKLVFDSTVLSNFLLADAISLLIKRYSHRGILSWEVYDELSAGFKKEPSLCSIELLFKTKDFDLVTLSKKEHAFYVSLLDSMGKGEASCIALACFSQSIVASDDKAARRICEIHKIPCTGTIGILIAACRDGLLALDKADQILMTMIEAGFYSPVRKISDVV
jgi:predicted nucleic acid-binding protein